VELAAAFWCVLHLKERETSHGPSPSNALLQRPLQHLLDHERVALPQHLDGASRHDGPSTILLLMHFKELTVVLLQDLIVLLLQFLIRSAR